ncbi:MAG: NAD(P)/FAD-dependent oxidoreductase [Actinomycetota bacterium]|nr:NAD(P)/FAD-dependent oxidoreductase [Actinomycetota bacterium]
MVVIGAGHNGLTAAAYLARAGRSVLVLERRGQVGGAATLERPFSDDRFVVSPCAYLVGLLHPLVVEELSLRGRGLRMAFVDPHLWCPFPDGTSLTLWDDAARSAAAVAEISPGDVDGYLAYDALFTRIRSALRGSYTEGTDTWLGPVPDRAAVEELLGHDPELVEIVFEASIADVVERHVADGRLRAALHGQGVIGTFAGPRERGTAWVHAHHCLGALEGRAGAWGYVEGGLGRVSLILAEAAEEAGALVHCGAEVAAIVPGEGVRLEGGELIRGGVVVANADPKRTLALVEGDVPEAFSGRVAAWRSESPVIKLNCALSRLPRFTAARPGEEPYRAMVTITSGINVTQAAVEAARRGEPAPAWCELYFQTAYDPSVAPPGAHTMSVFAQYAPYRLAAGDWDGRREEIADGVLAEIARFAPDVADCVVERQVLGPPDVEARIGLTGGHIFQGEILPDQMWDRRFGARTPVPGLYLCGAGTHPGGSVMAVNGRNAAMTVLDDLGVRRPPR